MLGGFLTTPSPNPFYQGGGMSCHVRPKVKGIPKSTPSPSYGRVPRGPWHISCMSLLGLPAD